MAWHVTWIQIKRSLKADPCLLIPPCVHFCEPERVEQRNAGAEHTNRVPQVPHRLGGFTTNGNTGSPRGLIAQGLGKINEEVEPVWRLTAEFAQHLRRFWSAA